MCETSVTLLGNIKNEDNEKDWERFYETYAPLIMDYARRLGEDPAKAQDVLQDTMVTLMTALKKFDYDPSKGKFRAFLRVIIWRSVMRSRRRSVHTKEISLDVGYGGADTPLVEILSAPEQNLTLEDAEEAEWQRALIQDAFVHIKANTRVSESSIAIFEDNVLNSIPAPEVAVKHGVSENTVYQIKNRTIKRIQEHINEIFMEQE